MPGWAYCGQLVADRRDLHTAHWPCAAPVSADQNQNLSANQSASWTTTDQSQVRKQADRSPLLQLSRAGSCSCPDPKHSGGRGHNTGVSTAHWQQPMSCCCQDVRGCDSWGLMWPLHSGTNAMSVTCLAHVNTLHYVTQLKVKLMKARGVQSSKVLCMVDHGVH